MSDGPDWNPITGTFTKRSAAKAVDEHWKDLVLLQERKFHHRHDGVHRGPGDGTIDPPDEQRTAFGRERDDDDELEL
jgi:hypothetical protein